MTKKILILVLTLVSIFSITACKDKEVVIENPNTNVVEVGKFVDVEDGTLTEELIAIFTDAEASWNGIPMEPIKLLQTQVVAGMNYKFLAKEVISNPDGSVKETYKEVIIYQDLEGNTLLLSANDYEGEIE